MRHVAAGSAFFFGNTSIAGCVMAADFYEQHLREFPPTKTLLEVDAIPYLGSVADFLRTLESRIGRELTLVRAGGTIPENAEYQFPVRLESGKTVGFLVASYAADENSGAAEVKRICESIAALLAEFYAYVLALRQAHEELALPKRIPATSVVAGRLSESLRQQLQTAARLIGANAAALYLLNNTNRTLVMRSCVGLPEERLLDAPRPLVEAAADLEAMLGYAVVINEDYLRDVWQPPENFPTAICVPVSSSTSILGTAWFYRDRVIDLSNHDIDILELSVGRIASELERAVQ